MAFRWFTFNGIIKDYMYSADYMIFGIICDLQGVCQPTSARARLLTKATELLVKIKICFYIATNL